MKQEKWVKTTAAVMLLLGLLAGCTPSGTDPGGAATAATGEIAAPTDQTEAEAAPTGVDSAGVSEEKMNKEGDNAMKITVEGNGHTIIFQLVDNSASRSLYDQLPLTVEVQDYSSDEKIFYPPDKLDTADAAVGQGPAGSLAYFSSWGNVIMYYGSYGPYNGLYELGTAVSGSEFIETMSGTVQIEKAE